ncbi:MAG: purine-nucleoside phosphorylase [Acidobacteriota bacterium]
MIFEKASEAAEFLKARYPHPIDVAIVLGSGLGAFAEKVTNAVAIPYAEIPHFSKSTVEGHRGRLVLGEIEGKHVAVQQGRFHFYEGYEMDEVTMPVRTFGRLGIKTLLLTNAAGGLRSDMVPGTLMLIRDHINLMGENPLRGMNDERLGPRFPDMTGVYDSELCELIRRSATDVAAKHGIEPAKLMVEGVYCGLSGPTYETPAEIRMLSLLGADAVGMSTVPEAIAARHQGMRVAGISCITNLAAGLTGSEIDHSEVMDIGSRVADTFGDLLGLVIAGLDGRK